MNLPAGAMSVLQAAGYRIGRRPWQTAATREAGEISRLFARGESGRHQPLGLALDLGCGPTCSRSRRRGVQDRRWSGLEFLIAVLAEFRRAGGAEQRYEHSRRAGAAALPREAIVSGDIPRRIFKDFYSSTIRNGEDAPL